jgi:hypothetical protein
MAQATGKRRGTSSQRYGQLDKCDPWHVGKRPSFIDAATNRLTFLVDEQGFLGRKLRKTVSPESLACATTATT